MPNFRNRHWTDPLFLLVFPNQYFVILLSRTNDICKVIYPAMPNPKRIDAPRDLDEKLRELAWEDKGWDFKSQNQLLSDERGAHMLFLDVISPSAPPRSRTPSLSLPHVPPSPRSPVPPSRPPLRPLAVYSLADYSEKGIRAASPLFGSVRLRSLAAGA